VMLFEPGTVMTAESGLVTGVISIWSIPDARLCARKSHLKRRF
jgi:hypothetical protein